MSYELADRRGWGSQRNKQTFSTVRRTKIKFQEDEFAQNRRKRRKKFGRKTEKKERKKEMQINCILMKIKRE